MLQSSGTNPRDRHQYKRVNGPLDAPRMNGGTVEWQAPLVGNFRVA